jgi:hypothetical protein
MDRVIVISDYFWESYERLDTKSRKIVRNTVRELTRSKKGKKFQLHKLDRVDCDDSFCSIRCNMDLRIILSEQGNKILLLHTAHHDKAYQWAKGKYLNIGEFGNLFIYDTNIKMDGNILNSMDVRDYPRRSNTLLGSKEIKVKDLVRLGISEIHAKYLMIMDDEEKFLEFISVFPAEVQEDLIDLATGTKSITEVYAELTDRQAAQARTIDQALEHKDSKRRFYITENLEELERIFDDFEKWKIYLHPKQREVAEKNYRGPVLVEGGPGTGKTVVGLHRAVYLSKNVYPNKDGYRILFCTFSRKLANYIDDKLSSLLKQQGIDSNIEVHGVDSLIFNLLKDHGIDRQGVDTYRTREILEYVYHKLRPKEPLDFYEMEYKEIIQKYHIRSLREYLRVDRKGQGNAINPSRRKAIWYFFESVLAIKQSEGVVDFDDKAYMLLEAVKKGRIKPMYDSVIIDEAQDLTPAQLRALISLVRQKENNVLILSDQNQRIYQLNSWRKDMHVDIVGRSFYLDLNYRTTKQIKEYADEQFMYSRKEESYLKSYKSILYGPEPMVYEFDSQSKQYDFCIRWIQDCIKRGVNPYEIGVVLPKKEIEKFAGALIYAGIQYSILEGDIYPKPGQGVSICSVQGCKGLEFRVALLINYDDLGRTLEQCMDSESWYDRQMVRKFECQKYVAVTRAREEIVITYLE